MLWGALYPLYQMITGLATLLLALVVAFQVALLILSIVVCAWVWWFLVGRTLGPPQRIP